MGCLSGIRSAEQVLEYKTHVKANDFKMGFQSLFICVVKTLCKYETKKIYKVYLSCVTVPVKSLDTLTHFDWYCS